MTTLVERAKTTHRRNIATVGKQTVTLRRNLPRATATVTITEAVGYEATYEIMGSDGITTQVTSMEWLLPQDQVLIDGVAVKPREDDQIITADGKTYEPMKMAMDRPEVVSHCGDEFWLVHSKLWRD